MNVNAKNLGTITIGNVKHDGGIRCCRPYPLGNPKRIGYPLSEIDAEYLQRQGRKCSVGEAMTHYMVIALHRWWLWGQLAVDSPVRVALFDLARQIREGKNLALLCHCVPTPRRWLAKGEAMPSGSQACHLDAVAAAVFYAIANNLDQANIKPTPRPSVNQIMASRREEQTRIDQLAREEALDSGEDLADARARIEVLSKYFGEPKPQTVRLLAPEIRDFAEQLEARRKLITESGVWR